MTKRILKIFSLILIVFVCINGHAQTDSTYSIIVAGHAYGAHAGTNIGLHPPFLEKLEQNIDSTYKYIFLTGDIVNHSDSESWQQVENELSVLGLNSCYVMGNHDNNSIGHEIFRQKYGGTYYSLTFRNELFIILNSTESDRSISTTQLSFLEQVLHDAQASQKKVFIFFHEVIWNSAEKYRLVRSNSRSRYDQMKDHSNFWDEVFPMLIAYPEKQFYLFAGDVGGNPDAIAASYDKWNNVTILSSGMGEVSDENYMKVDIQPDTVNFTLIPLRDGIEMHPISWYNVPESPAYIEGSEKIIPPEFDLPYRADSVFNATSYNWSLTDGMFGQSDSSSIILDFDANFKDGELSVTAFNDGFGESEPVVLEITSEDHTSVYDQHFKANFDIQQSPTSIQIIGHSESSEKAHLRIYNSIGRLLFFEEIVLNPGIFSKSINKSSLQQGLVIIELSCETERFVQKCTVFN